MKPGHTVRFTGLKGAAHLNGTEGTLLRYDRAQERWAVRCDSDQKIVNARPANLEVVKHEAQAPPRRRRGNNSGAGSGHFDYGGGGGGDGPTFGSVLAAARGADCKEEYYLRTLLALAQQGPQPEAQELVVEAIEAFVNAGQFDGDKGERFVKHLHRRTREEEAAGNGTTAEIMGFIDTVVLAKMMNRFPTKGGRPVIPKWFRGSLAGSMSFQASMAAEAGATAARKTASEITRVVDGEDSDDDDMEIPNIPED